MKHLRPMLAVAIVMLAMAMPSISAAQYHEERLDQFLNQRPELKEQLERNPNLIYNKAVAGEASCSADVPAEPSQHLGKATGHDRMGRIRSR